MMGQRRREQVQRGCAVGTVVLLAWLCRVLPLEGMPSGLQEACGILRLCNRQMFRVYRALSGRDLQSLEELRQQVWAPTHGRRVDGKNPSFVLPDGTCWLYSEQTVFGEGVRPHVECIFSEVTDLQRQRQELLRQNQELLRMNRELRRLSENVQEMTREKEIMAFKTRLHDEMGYGLTAVRQCLLQRKDPAELGASLEQMNKAVQLFRKDSETPPEENPEEMEEPRHRMVFPRRGLLSLGSWRRRA